MQTITITTDKGETIQVKGEITVDGKPLSPPVKEKQYPWEKSFERVCLLKKSYCVDMDSSIDDIIPSRLYNEHKNTVPTESIALSTLAYTQLKVITTDMNGTAEILTPEMNGGTVYVPYYSFEEECFIIGANTIICESPFPVRTESLCKQLIDENTELLEQFYEIKK